MRRDRREAADVAAVSSETGVPEEEVLRAVRSFFGDIAARARRLPFADTGKIHRRSSFDRHLFAVNIPSVGRLGPVYSRYLGWLGNEAAASGQESRVRLSRRMSGDDIERLADDILSGRGPVFPERRKVSDDYRNVWIVDAGGRHRARQVFPKKD